LNLWQLAQSGWASEALLTAVSFIVVFGTIVLFHELGHFAAAKAFGVRVHEFSIGIGPCLAAFRRRETQYSIRMLPLGGFVKLAGMDAALRSEDEISEGDARSFNNRPLWQRMAIFGAGPLMNFFLAFLLIAGYYMTVFVPPTVTRVNAGSAAQEAGLRPGDVILAVGGTETRTAEDVIRLVRPNAGKELLLTVRRGDKVQEIRVVPRFDSATGAGLLGIEIRSQPRLGFLSAVARAAGDTWRGTVGIAQAIAGMVTGRTAVDLRGPIGIIAITGEAAREGIDALITLAIGLNLNLGLLNLLPIPVLDGGWLMLLAFEGLRGRPLEPEQRGMAQFVGLVIIFLLTIYAFYQDVIHLNT